MGTGGVFDAPDVVTPLDPWLRDRRAVRRAWRAVGRRPFVLLPRRRGWRDVVPSFEVCVTMAANLPFHIAAERRYDRRADPRRLRPALARGKTVYLPQIHQVLPRLMRLVVALRVAFMGGARDEASFLFMVEGSGRQGLGLHHDGDVDSFWLQLEGRRTVTLGPPVERGIRQELSESTPRVGRGWSVLDLPPGSLLHLPPRTPHEVVCYGRSLAVSLTWQRRARQGNDARAMLGWDVVSGRVDRIPPAHRTWLWTQVPALARRTREEVVVVTAENEQVSLNGATWPVVRTLPSMPRLRVPAELRPAIAPLLAAGILGPQDLPVQVRPEDAAALDGWRFG